MTITLTVAEAYARGRKMAEERLPSLDHARKCDYIWARGSYLGAEDLDFEAALVQFSQDRMASELDLTKYPACRGMREVVIALRQGVADVVNDPARTAHLLDWYMFASRRLNTRYVGKQPLPAQCTSFCFHETAEGGPVHAGNVDDLVFRCIGTGFRANYTPSGNAKPSTIDTVTCVGGVSSAVLCDDEPECLFPVDLGLVIPQGITDLREYIGYLDLYKEFWGPGNQLWTDGRGNYAALEKANVRLGVRYSSGWGAITACSYLTPEMNAFKKERDLRSYLERGYDVNDNMDKAYWDGDESRYRRLLHVVQQEFERGATVLGAAQIALDHKAPFPERICLAGERGHRDEVEGNQNWTLLSTASCTSGPNTRTYGWVIDPDNLCPIYKTECFITPGEGQEARLPEWEAEVQGAGEVGLHPIA